MNENQQNVARPVAAIQAEYDSLCKALGHSLVSAEHTKAVALNRAFQLMQEKPAPTPAPETLSAPDAPAS